MPHLNRATVACAAALCLLGASPADATVDSGSAKSAAAESDAINKKIRALWASHACFQRPQSDTHDSTEKCWAAAKPEAAAAAAAKTSDLIARLDALAEFDLSTFVIFKAKLNLMTRMAMFCEEGQIPSDQVDILATQANTFHEWTSSLYVCARQTKSADMHERLRGELAKNITPTFPKGTRLQLLRLWFDSLILQHSPNGDLAKVAKAMKNDVDSWKTFVGFMVKDASSYKGDRNPFSVSAEDLKKAKTALFGP